MIYLEDDVKKDKKCKMLQFMLVNVQLHPASSQACHLTLLLPRVPKIKIQDKSQISLCKFLTKVNSTM